MEVFETKIQELIGKYTSDEGPAELQEAVVNDLQSLLSSSENVKQTFSTLRKERLNAGMLCLFLPLLYVIECLSVIIIVLFENGKSCIH